jgi:HAD superfamily hydrolase (TIGR01484 family)
VNDEVAAIAPRIKGVFCDIDGTLTHDGRLPASAYAALWALREAGLRVVPVTGRPGGWVDLIARMWPVDGVVGENGGLWFWRDQDGVHKRFLQPADERARNRARLTELSVELLRAVPGTALASDQPYRELDLAIDYCEDVPALGEAAADAIQKAFIAAGATAKISDIHVNGWFGDFDKLTGCRRLVRDRWNEDLDATRDSWLYVGDSANDEPMFEHFPYTVGVSNVAAFLSRMEHHPRWITKGPGGEGFAELARMLLADVPEL